MAMFSTLDEALSYLDNPTPYRNSISNLLAKLDDSDANSRDVAEALANDSMLSASVMKIANSAYYGMSGRVGSLPSAVSVLGFLTIRSLGIAALLNSSIGSNSLNVDHLILAGLSTAIASEMGDDLVPVATATCVGLLADIGLLMLKNKHVPEYDYALLSLSRKNDVENIEVEIMEIEREIFGFDHCQIGGHLLRAWSFPEDICQAVESHSRDESNVPLEQVVQRAVRLLPLYKEVKSRNIEDCKDGDPTYKLFCETRSFINEYLAIAN